MTPHRLTVASVLILLTTSVGQSKRGDPWGEINQIGSILGAAHVSGTLAYSGCGFLESVPDDPPPMRVLFDYSGPPKEVLQKVFADDPNMQVTQEQEGIIRMMEADVPKDLLEFKIHHLSFLYDHGPIVAMELILHTDEVRRFRMEHKIGPEADWGAGFGWPGGENPSKPKRVIPGIPVVLNDVTLAQALDYVTMTFPGFWSYESCVSKEGKRSVRFSFHEHLQLPKSVFPGTTGVSKR